MFKSRMLTALVLIVLFVLVIWFFTMPWLSLVIGAVIAWGAWEWSSLVGITHGWGRALYVALIILALLSTYFLPIPWVLFISLIAWLWAITAVLLYARGRSSLGFDRRWVKALMGFLALVPCWLAVIVLHEDIGGPVWLLFGLAVICAADVGAYISGKLWGRHILIARVSPNKTWEGFWGGLILAALISVVVCLAFRVPFSHLLMITLLAVITALFAIIGDLFESMLKRQAGIKDSGGGLPGHGGILDRIDSATAALPIFTLGSLFLGLMR